MLALTVSPRGESRNEVEVGMRFRSTSPVFRGDGIEWPTGTDFEVVALDRYWIKLKSEVEGQRFSAMPVSRKKDDKDHFNFVNVNLDTLNRQFKQVK